MKCTLLKCTLKISNFSSDSMSIWFRYYILNKVLISMTISIVQRVLVTSIRSKAIDPSRRALRSKRMASKEIKKRKSSKSQAKKA